MTTIDRVLVISLDRTPERLETFKTNNASLPIERFVAVDGQELDRWDCVDSGLITPGNPYSLGQLGNALSHVALWRRCAAENRALHIAEDDAIFRQDFVSAASAILAALVSWDIVVWGWNFDWPMQVELGPGLGPVVLQYDQDALRAQWKAFPASTPKTTLLRLISNAGSCAYSISPKGAQRLLQRCLPISGKPAAYAGKSDVAWTNRSLDVEMTRHYAALEAFVTVPCLAVSLNVKSESTI